MQGNEFRVYVRERMCRNLTGELFGGDFEVQAKCFGETGDRLALGGLKTRARANSRRLETQTRR